MMDLARGYRAKTEIKVNELKTARIGLNPDTIVIIKLPVLRIVSRSLFLAMVILTLPFILSIARGSSNALYDSDLGLDSIGFESLPVLFRDLGDEGIIKEGDKGLIVSPGVGDSVEDLEFLSANDIDLVIESDLDRQNSITNEVFDFVFSSSFRDNTGFIDRVLKIDGIVVMQLSNDPSDVFHKHPNYKIVYLRRFDSTVVAMKKVGAADASVNSPTKRRLFGFTTEAKKAALTGLEDVLLEPPRRALAKSSNQFRKIKFLPDLLGDSLESYKRRIFVTDEKNDALKWFNENYPRRNKVFEVYNLEMEMSDSENVGRRSLKPLAIGVSDWLWKNVKKDDYVVMKAEAEMVEEMIKEKTVRLVDELFLECKNQWEENGGEENKRAYWQCLALYGRLRDEGVAVHQWWG